MLYLYESSFCSVEFSSVEMIVAEDSNSLEKLKQGCKVSGHLQHIKYFLFKLILTIFTIQVYS